MMRDRKAERISAKVLSAFISGEVLLMPADF
jgi:hypothetical protein